MSGLLLYPSPHYFLRQSLSLSPSLIQWSWQASELGTHLSVSSRHWNWTHALPRLDSFLSVGVGEQTGVLRMLDKLFMV